jgi:hypothetical protein
MRLALSMMAVVALSGCKAATVWGAGDGGSGSGTDGGTQPGTDGGGGSDAGQGGWDGGPLTNVVDQIVVPMLLENGLPVTTEDPGVLCRRLAIDLSGITPTASEIAGICTQSPSQIADFYMSKTSGVNSPADAPYVWVNRRWWADLFQYQAGSGSASTHTFYVYDRDLDALVHDLYAGTIMYDEFTRRSLASPAFARRFGIFDTNQDLIQLASQAFRVFMGREALPSEAQDFGNLWTPWVTLYWSNAPTLVTYPDCADVQSGGQCYHSEIAVNAAACAGVNALSCTSTVLGAAQVIPVGTGTTAFDGGWSPAMETALEAPGAVMTTQPQWAEAAVDRELVKYLGWWEAGFYVPDFELPAVRTALAQYFAANGYDVRALDKEIVTSVLYTEASAIAPGEMAADPIWAFGPTKMLYAEAWLDSLGQAFGKQLGGCDFRYPAWNYASQISDYVNFPETQGLNFNYPSEAGLMGGCPISSPHGDPTGILPAATRRAILVQLCPGSFPAGSQTLTQIAQTEFASVGRAGSAADITSAVTELMVPADGSCDPNNLGACPMQQMADGLCNGLFASAAYNFY